jgi:hypothetical protein
MWPSSDVSAWFEAVGASVGAPGMKAGNHSQQLLSFELVHDHFSEKRAKTPAQTSGREWNPRRALLAYSLLATVLRAYVADKCADAEQQGVRQQDEDARLTEDHNRDPRQVRMRLNRCFRELPMHRDGLPPRSAHEHHDL